MLYFDVFQFTKNKSPPKKKEVSWKYTGKIKENGKKKLHGNGGKFEEASWKHAKEKFRIYTENSGNFHGSLKVPENYENSRKL